MNPDTIAIWLRQLERLGRLQRDYDDDVNDLGRRLMRRAMTARYLDLVRAGAEVEASQVLARFGPVVK